MSEPLKFRISSELKNIIGRDLITDDFIAIFELVKNSFDARAKKVELIFKHVKKAREKRDEPTGRWADHKNKEQETIEGRIFVKDDGDGMSANDLIKKWLLVGHSEKRVVEESLKDTDYREKIHERRTFAGAKGIGRFSCDKLGSKLTLYTKIRKENHFHILEMDWDKFEEDPNTLFQEVDVTQRTSERPRLEIDMRGFTSGTVLEISGLRSNWDATKLRELKRHLQRLINPAQVSAEHEFRIYLEAEEFRKADEGKKDYDKINGFVRNFVFERLNIKTTHVTCEVKGTDTISTSLVDKGTFVYSIEERNRFDLLHDIRIELFFLNRQAKTEFTTRMGIEPVRYGSVFFYKNGIKINPCGNEGDDWLGLDRRKTQGTRRYLGNRDVVGRVEVNGFQPGFTEVSSRAGGVIRTAELSQLEEFFVEKALRRLERYVVEGISWDSAKGKDPSRTKADSFKIVNQLIEKAETDGRKIEFNENLLENYAKDQLQRTPELVKNVQTVRKFIRSRQAKSYLDLQVKAVRGAFRDLQRRQRELEQDLEEKERHALFMEHVAESDKTEMKKLQHQIGLDTDIIDGVINRLKGKIDRNETIPRGELLDVIDTISLQTQMISSITSFVLHAKFDLMKQVIRDDLIKFIRQYIERVYVPYNEMGLQKKRVEVLVEDTATQFTCSFNPFEFIVIVDNMINNSTKAKANTIQIRFEVPRPNLMELHVKDDGIGIPDKNLDKIFEFGFSTTGGSGIGLYNVRKLLNNHGSIEVNNKLKKGVEFVIRVKK